MAGSNITLQLAVRHARYLERRGGRAHRGNGPFSRTVVLGRMLDNLRLYQEFTDPRIPEEFHDLIVHLLPEPWTLKPFEIKNLEAVLDSTPGFAESAAAAGVDPAALIGALAAITPAEKLTLVDHAIQHQAPGASAASPESP